MFSGKAEAEGGEEQKNEKCGEDMELPTFDLAAIIKATDNFSVNNKLGEGGFGPVYKVNREPAIFICLMTKKTDQLSSRICYS